MKLSQSFVVASLSVAQVGLSAPVPDSPDPNLLSPRPSENNMNGALSPRMNPLYFGRRSPSPMGRRSTSTMARRTPSPMALEARDLLKAAANLSVGGGGGGGDGESNSGGDGGDDDHPKPSHRHHSPPKQEHAPKPKQQNHPRPHKPKKQDDHEGSGTHLNSDTQYNGGSLRSQTNLHSGNAHNRNNDRPQSPPSAPRGGGGSGGGDNGGGGGGLLDLGVDLSVLKRDMSLNKRDFSQLLSTLSPTDLALLKTELSQLPILLPQATSSSNNQTPNNYSSNNESNGSKRTQHSPSLINGLDEKLTETVNGVPVAGGMLSGGLQALPLSGLTDGLTDGPIGGLVNGLAGPLESLPMVGDTIKGVMGTVLPNSGKDSQSILTTVKNTVGGLPVVGAPLSGIMSGLPLDTVTNLVTPLSGALDKTTGTVSGIPVLGSTLSNTMGSLPVPHILAATGTSDSSSKGGMLAGVTGTATGAIGGLPVVGGPLSAAVGSLPLDSLTKGGLLSSATGTVSGAVNGLPVVGSTISGAIGSLPLDPLTKGSAVSNVLNMVTTTAGGLPVVGGPLSTALGSIPADTVTKALPISLMAMSSDGNSTSTLGHSFNALPISDDPASLLAAAGGALPIQPSNSLDGLTLPNYLGGNSREVSPTPEKHEAPNQFSAGTSPQPYIMTNEQPIGENRIDLNALIASHGLKPDPTLNPVSNSSNSTMPQISLNDTVLSDPTVKRRSSELTGPPLISQTGNRPVHSFIELSDLNKSSNSSPTEAENIVQSIPPREEDMQDSNSSKSNGKSSSGTKSNNKSTESTSSSSSPSSNPSSSSSVSQSSSSSTSANPFAGVFAPKYDSSFGFANQQKPLNKRSSMDPTGTTPTSTTGSGQPTASTPPALSPVFETVYEHVTPPGPMHTPSPRISTDRPSTMTAFQVERESGTVARRWFGGTKGSTAKQGFMKRFWGNSRDSSKLIDR